MSTIKFDQEDLQYFDEILHDPKSRISFWQKVLDELSAMDKEALRKKSDESLLKQLRNQLASLFK